MAIDPATETLRTFAEAARRLPPLRKGRPVNPATLWRWATRGVRTRGGVIVRLEILRLGGTCCTSAEALARFFRALTAGTAQAFGTTELSPQRDSPKNEADGLAHVTAVDVRGASS
jgi:hypothetical protein